MKRFSNYHCLCKLKKAKFDITDPFQNSDYHVWMIARVFSTSIFLCFQNMKILNARKDWYKNQQRNFVNALSKIRFELFSEGQAAQTMHLGPFSEEGPTVERVHAFILENRSSPVGETSRDLSE